MICGNNDLSEGLVAVMASHGYSQILFFMLSYLTIVTIPYLLLQDAMDHEYFNDLSETIQCSG